MTKNIDWEKLDENSRAIILSFLQAAFLCVDKKIEKDWFLNMAKETWEWTKIDPKGSYDFWQAAVDIQMELKGDVLD